MVRNVYVQSDRSTITQFSFQSFDKSHTFILFQPCFLQQCYVAAVRGQVKAGSKWYFTALLRIDEHSATVDDNKEFEGGTKRKGKTMAPIFLTQCACQCVCLCVNVDCTYRGSDDQRGRSNLKTEHCGQRSRFML